MLNRETVAATQNAPRYSCALTGSSALIITCDEGVERHEQLVGKGTMMHSEHHATLVELCRQQHEALAQSVAMLTQVETLVLNGEHDKLAALGPFIYDSRMRSIQTLALWPDDPTEET